MASCDVNYVNKPSDFAGMVEGILQKQDWGLVEGYFWYRGKCPANPRDTMPNGLGRNDGLMAAIANGELKDFDGKPSKGWGLCPDIPLSEYPSDLRSAIQKTIHKPG